MRALLILLLLLPFAGAPGNAVVAVGTATDSGCAEDFLVQVAYDAATGSAAMRGSPVGTCGAPHWVWRAGLCDDNEGTIACADYYPTTVGGVTTLYFYTWLNMTLEPDGDFRFTRQRQGQAEPFHVFGGPLTRVDA